MTLTDEPQAIFGMPEGEYHAMKALSASGAWTLAEECPAKFLWESPWNPAYVPPDKTAFDIGTAAHLAILEPKRQREKIVVIDAADYRTRAAQDARDAARAENRVPLLVHQVEIIARIAAAIEAHPIASAAFADGGDPEVTLTWRDPGMNVPSKIRVDWLPRHRRWLIDLKTAASANPRAWIDQAFRLGYHARASWYLDGAEAVFKRAPEEYWFVVVEKEPPYLVSVISFDEQALEWGRISNRRARDLFMRAAATGDWHGYREPDAKHDRAFRVSLPPWATFRLQDRDNAGDFKSPAKVDPGLLRAAERWLAPTMEAS
jgi:hypothetical protein